MSMASGGTGLWLALGTAGALVAASALARREASAPLGRGSRTVVPRGLASDSWAPSGSRPVSGSRAALDAAARARLPASDFVFPRDRSYPIHDRDHGRLALTYAATPSNRLRLYRVMQAVFARYPDLRLWWNTTPSGKRDPANMNNWRTTLYEYQALLPRLLASARAPQAQALAVDRERADVAQEIEALRALSRAPTR